MMKNDEATREALSALIDGELEREPSRFLLRRLESDTELRATYARYHLISSALKREAFVPAPDSFADGLVSKVAASAVPSRSWQRRAWVRPALGSAIAAGVAALALIVIVPGQPGSQRVGSIAAVGAVPETSAVALTPEASVPVLAADTRLRTDDFAAVLPLRQVSETWATPLGAQRVAPFALDPAVERYFLGHSAGGASARGGMAPQVNMVAWPAARAIAPAEREPVPIAR